MVPIYLVQTDRANEKTTFSSVKNISIPIGKPQLNTTASQHGANSNRHVMSSVPMTTQNILG